MHRCGVTLKPQGRLCHAHIDSHHSNEWNDILKDHILKWTPFSRKAPRKSSINRQHVNTEAVSTSCDYFSLRVHLRSVGWPLYPLRSAVISEYILSALARGMPSQIMMSTTITAVSQWWPGRSRTKQRTFSSLLLLLKTCKIRTHLYLQKQHP